jgi:hypothetical protein
VGYSRNNGDIKLAVPHGTFALACRRPANPITSQNNKVTIERTSGYVGPAPDEDGIRVEAKKVQESVYKITHNTIPQFPDPGISQWAPYSSGGSTRGEQDIWILTGILFGRCNL